MYSYVKIHEGPVVEGMEEAELVYAEHQPEYLPLRTLKSKGPDGRVVSRWTPTSEQRKLLADGADIFLELLTFHQPLQPIRIAVCDGNVDNDWVRVCLLDSPAKV